MSFVSVHVHTDYSNCGMLDSINRIENIVKQIKNLGQVAWCITDHNGCSGIIDAYKQSQKAGLKLIPGAELYYTADLTIQQRDLSHITFWAKDNEGLENLYKLTTEAHGDKGRNPNNFYYKSRVDLDLIRRYSKGIMLGSACLGGFINRPNGEEVLKELLEIFPGDTFLELHTYQCEEQYVYNRRLIDLSQKYNLPLIAATDAHFTLKEHAELRRLFKNTSKEQDDSEHVDDTLYLQSEDEIRDNLKYLPKEIVEQSLENTQILSDKSNVTIEFGNKYYPEYPCDDPIEELKKQCRVGWKQKGLNKYPNRQEYIDRFNKVELPIIEKQGYAPYFLVTSDLYKFGRERGYPIPPGRGSAVASLILWFMGVTQLDPIKYNCIFERFAHMERISPPDIDNDLSKKHRNEYIKHVQDTYGEVYPCRTFSTIGPGKAIGIAGKALGYDPQETIRLSKSLSQYESDDEDDNTSSYDKKIWMLDHIKTDEIAELIELAKKFVGIIYGFSKHASALIVLNQDINKFCSVERQTDTATKKPCYVAACNFKYLEEIGLMKLDMLGLKTLDIVQDTTDSLNDFLGNFTDKIYGTTIKDTVKSIGKTINIQNIPLEDDKTSQMLIQGKTCGCFQISSNGMTQLVKQIKPKGFSDLIPLVALFRPGPLGAKVEETGESMVQTYVKVKNGEIKPIYLHPKLEPILQDTYSITLYQEQILEIAKQLCGYSLGEADVLRRIIGKKKIDEMKPALETMVQRGVDNGISKEIMEKITHQIVEFASYCFNKSHSAGYGLLAWQTSYLKAHYPLQFLCACLNNEEGQQEAFIPFINECKNLGIKVLPPDITKINMEWIIEEDSIRVSLSYIKGVGSLKLDSSWETINDYIEGLPKNKVEALIKSGAMDLLGNRLDMLRLIYPSEQYPKDVERITKRIAKYKPEDKAKIQKAQKELEKVNAKELSLVNYNLAADEISVLGFSFNELPRIKTGKLLTIKEFKDKKGKLMSRVSLKSDYGDYSGVIFAYLWSKCKSKLTEGDNYRFIWEDGVITE